MAHGRHQSRCQVVHLRRSLPAPDRGYVQRPRPHGREAAGPYHWHSHPDTDDFFLVLKGRLTIRMREGDVTLGPGEMYVVPRGVEHCPVAEEETHILLIEPTGTPNSGDPATAAPRRVI